MDSILDFLFSPRTLLVIGGLIAIIASLFTGLLNKEKLPKWMIWITFIGGIIVIIGGFKADIDQENNTNALLEKTEIIAEQSNIITNLSKENVDQSKYIANTLTGGKSFCYIMFKIPVDTTNVVPRYLIHNGDYPLHNVFVRIINVNEYKEMLEDKLPLTLERMFALDEILTYDILLPQKAKILPSVSCSKYTDKIDFNVFFSARNGDWVQENRFRLVEGKWHFATRVKGWGDELLLEISDNYPLNDKSEVDW